MGRTNPAPAAPPPLRGMGSLALVFLGLAVALALDLWGHVMPLTHHDLVESRYVDKATVRDPLLTPKLVTSQFNYRCAECHDHFEPNAGTKDLIAEHTEIRLDHGANSLCFNCHNPENLETLQDYEGKLVAFSASEQLCRTCHGPKYRDWVAGAHGRPNGYWDLTRGSSVKATCVQCHDPHAPRFKPLAPGPGPREERSVRGAADHG